MSVDWCNEESILRDLAIAQGGVPVGEVNVVSSNEKPPAIHIAEETEEQYLQQNAGDADTNTAPDLGLIQEMLYLVRDVRVSEIEDPEAIKVEECNKILHESNKKGDCQARSPLRTLKTAVSGNYTQNKNNTDESMTDLNENQQSKDLSDTDIKMTKENEINNGVTPFVVSPVNMFKPKPKNCTENACASDNVNSPTKPTSQHKLKAYVPSSQAQAYYDRLMENKTQKELREETIWTRAERQMKEIEAKRRKEKEMALAQH